MRKKGENMVSATPFSVQIKTTAKKYLKRKRGQELQRLMDGINAIRKNPVDPRNKMKGAGDCYRLRVGDERIVYTVNKAEGKIIIHAINNRGQVYGQ